MGFSIFKIFLDAVATDKSPNYKVRLIELTAYMIKNCDGNLSSQILCKEVVYVICTHLSQAKHKNFSDLSFLVKETLDVVCFAFKNKGNENIQTSLSQFKNIITPDSLFLSIILNQPLFDFYCHSKAPKICQVCGSLFCSLFLNFLISKLVSSTYGIELLYCYIIGFLD